MTELFRSTRKHNRKKARRAGLRSLPALLAAMAMLLSLTAGGTAAAAAAVVEAEETAAGELVFEADASSVYAVVYMVDSDAAGSDVAVLSPQLSLTLFDGAERVGDDWVYTPTNIADGHDFSLRISYAFSTDSITKTQWEPGEIEFRIPRSILVDRDGSPADTYLVSVPGEDDPTVGEDNRLVFREEDDYIVIYNRLPMDPAQVGSIEISYSTSEASFAYVDYGTEDGAGNDISASREASVTMTIRDGEEVIYTDTSDPITVHIDTNARVVSTAKKKPTQAAQSWADRRWTLIDEAGETVETEPDTDGGSACCYLVWPVTTVVEASQPFTFRLDDVFSPAYGEVLGYCMQETEGMVFSPVNTAEISALSAIRAARTDYVLTRIQRDYYDELLADQGGFEVTNQVTATVTPLDHGASSTAGSSASYQESRKEYHGVAYQAKSGKTGLSTSYQLTDLVKGELTEIAGLDYAATLDATTFRYTYAGDPALADSEEGVDGFGKALVELSLTDDTLWLEYYDAGGQAGVDGTPAESRQLTPDEYRIDALMISYTLYDGEYDAGEKAFRSAAMNSAALQAACDAGRLEDLIITLQCGGEYDDSLAIRYSFRDGSFTLPDGMEGLITVSGDTLRFAKEMDVTGYTLTNRNALYRTSLRAAPSVTLKGSNLLSGIYDTLDPEAPELTLVNRAQFSAGTDGTVFYADQDTASDDVVGNARKSQITKEYVARQNDTVRSRYLITWESEMADAYTVHNNTRYITQQGGTFYDLLPLGASYVPGSLYVYADDQLLDEGQYELTVTSNVSGGRALMEVRCLVPGDRYRLRYTTAIPWDAILEQRVDDKNTAQRNAVVYVTGNEDLGAFAGDAYHDPRRMTAAERTDWAKAYYDENEGRAISAVASCPVGALISTSFGLGKLVRATDLNSTYRKSAVVYPGGEYSYELRFGPEQGTKADSLVLFDLLEAHDGSAWHGALESVNTSMAAAMGAAPVVYYSALDRAQLESLGQDAYALDAVYDGAPVWTAASGYAGGLSAVTAVAVDLTRTSSGRDFVLEGGQVISIYINMRAPSSAAVLEDGSPVEDAMANNAVSMQLRQVKEEAELASGAVQTMHEGHTEVSYYISGALRLKKVGPDGTTGIQGVTFRLTGTSAYGNAVDMTRTTAADGTVRFRDIEIGEDYLLQEVSGVPDYQVNDTPLRVRVAPDGTAVIDLEDGEAGAFVSGPDSEGVYVVQNESRAHGDLTLIKTGRVDGGADRTLEGVVFELAGESDYGRDVDIFASSDRDGVVRFENVEKGSHYTLTELRTADGYILDRAEVQVVCDADGNFLLSGGENLLQNPDGSYTLINEPLHGFGLYKVDGVSGDQLTGAAFRLTGVSDNGSVVQLTGVSQNGQIDFENLIRQLSAAGDVGPGGL